MTILCPKARDNETGHECPVCEHPFAMVVWKLDGQVTPFSNVVNLMHGRTAGYDDETVARRVLACARGLDAEQVQIVEMVAIR